MIGEYTKFFFNGSILGIIAWGLHLFAYQAMGGNSDLLYMLSSTLTYLLLIVINFTIQRTWIFKRPGLFTRFVIANLSIMLFVSLLSPFCRFFIDVIAGIPWGDRGGFIFAALLGSIPSFLLKRHWVFSQ
jgi:hypothetical protein